MTYINDIKSVVDTNDPKQIAKYISDNNLVTEGNKIKLNETYINNQVEFWDKRQHVKKINLNS